MVTIIYDPLGLLRFSKTGAPDGKINEAVDDIQNFLSTNSNNDSIFSYSNCLIFDEIRARVLEKRINKDYFQFKLHLPGHPAHDRPYQADNGGHFTDMNNSWPDYKLDILMRL